MTLHGPRLSGRIAVLDSRKDRGGKVDAVTYRIEVPPDSDTTADTLDDAVRWLERLVTDYDPFGRITLDGQTIVTADWRDGDVWHRRPCPCDDCTQLDQQLQVEAELEAFSAAEARTWFPEDSDEDEESER